MKKHFLKTAALCALMLSATETFAQIPEHVYMVGTASPSAWYIEDAVEMTNEGDGVFTYHGVLYKQQLQFITDRNWDAVRYVPPVDGWHLVEAHTTADILGQVGNENKFWVGDVGTYHIKLTVSNEGKIAVKAEMVGDPAPQVVMMGAVSGQWDSVTPHMSANIYPADEENPDVFVWEGVPAPHEACKHLKFIDYPCNYWETNFFVPAMVNYNDNVQLVEDGGEYDVVKRWGGDGGRIDDFWGFAAEDCDGSTYRVTLDIANLKIKFENISPMIGTSVQTPDAATVKAFFTGDQLVVKGATAAIEVYDMAGIRVAYSEGETLLMSDVPDGVYIVKSGTFVQKICK